MKERGFSLFELLVVLAIVAIIVVARFSHFSSFYTRNNEQFVKRQFIATIEHARDMARTSRQRTIFCATQDLQNCNADGANIMSFVDSYNDGRVHDKQQIISSQSINLDGTIHWRTFPNYRNYLSFDPVGFLHADNGTIWYCAPQKKGPRWVIVINKTGRIREEKAIELPC